VTSGALFSLSFSYLLIFDLEDDDPYLFRFNYEQEDHGKKAMLRFLDLN
jgi:hypothetical protein